MKLELQDTVYEGITPKHSGGSSALVPVDVLFVIKCNKRHIRDMQFHFKLIKGITPNWYLRRLVKEIYGK